MQEEVVNAKPKRWRWKIAVSFILLIILALGYGYYWFTGVTRRDHEAKTLISEAAYGKNLSAAIQNEYDRCQNFIVQKQGDFSSFEYCKKFIEWVNNNNLSHL